MIFLKETLGGGVYLPAINNQTTKGFPAISKREKTGNWTKLLLSFGKKNTKLFPVIIVYAREGNKTMFKTNPNNIVI